MTDTKTVHLREHIASYRFGGLDDIQGLLWFLDDHLPWGYHLRLEPGSREVDIYGPDECRILPISDGGTLLLNTRTHSMAVLTEKYFNVSQSFLYIDGSVGSDVVKHDLSDLGATRSEAYRDADHNIVMGEILVQNGNATNFRSGWLNDYFDIESKADLAQKVNLKEKVRVIPTRGQTVLFDLINDENTSINTEVPREALDGVLRFDLDSNGRPDLDALDEHDIEHYLDVENGDETLYVSAEKVEHFPGGALLVTDHHGAFTMNSEDADRFFA